MALETVTYITDLNANNPQGTDQQSQGDDHLRNIKLGLLNTFQGFTGEAITVSEADINNIITTDSAQTITAGNKIFNDNVKIIFGTGSDSEFYWSGTEMIISTAVNFGALPNVAGTDLVLETRNLIAGTGLTGGGTLASDVTLNVIGGDGITANANDIQVDSTVVRTSGNQTIAGTKTFSTRPSTAGLQNSGSLTFVSNSATRLTIETNGTISVNTANYENLVTADDDIPNKKYVDDTISSSFATANTHTGTSTITTLTAGKKYLVSVFGYLTNRGTGNAFFSGVIVRNGTLVGSGTILATTSGATIDWPDGAPPTSCTFVITASTSNINGTVDGNAATYMAAVQLD